MNILLLLAALTLNQPRPTVAESTVTLLEVCHVARSDWMGDSKSCYLIGWSRCSDGKLHYQWDLLLWYSPNPDVNQPVYFPGDSTVRFEIDVPYKIRFHNYRETWTWGSPSHVDDNGWVNGEGYAPQDLWFRPGLPSLEHCYAAYPQYQEIDQ